MVGMKRLCATMWLVLAASLAGGCTAMGPKVSPDIIRVSTFYNKQNPWLNFDRPPRPVPGGVKFTVYLSSPDTALGVFGDGVIHVDLFRVDSDADGDPVQTPLRRWSFDKDQAYPYRVRRKSRLGWAYGFRLPWGEVDVLGKEVMFLVSFERRDGRVIYGQPVRLKVPRKV